MKMYNNLQCTNIRVRSRRRGEEVEKEKERSHIRVRSRRRGEDVEKEKERSRRWTSKE